MVLEGRRPTRLSSANTASELADTNKELAKLAAAKAGKGGGKGGGKTGKPKAKAKAKGVQAGFPSATIQKKTGCAGA